MTSWRPHLVGNTVRVHDPRHYTVLARHPLACVGGWDRWHGCGTVRFTDARGARVAFQALTAQLNRVYHGNQR